MSTPLLDRRSVRVVIRSVGITAASGTEARRIADALVPALERAFASIRSGSPSHAPRSQRPADRVASQIAAAVAEELRGTS